jgi:hypothetical protein
MELDIDRLLITVKLDTLISLSGEAVEIVWQQGDILYTKIHTPTTLS